jgi:hypothetical protein
MPSRRLVFLLVACSCLRANAQASLQKGWACYAESLILVSDFGPDMARYFWLKQAESYLRNPSGAASSYAGSGWLFRMLEDGMGSDRFARVIAGCPIRPPATWEIFADCAQRQARNDFDVRKFLMPWLNGNRAPRLTATANVRTVTIHQEAPYFTLPVVIEAMTEQGPERHRVWITGAEASVDFFSFASDPKIDPDGLLLLDR